MRIPVLVQYLAYHAQPSGRVIQKPVFEIVNFEVSAATTDEAPVAIRWNDMPHETQVEGWDTWDENGNGHTRWFGDRHWKPLYDDQVLHGPVCALDADFLESLATSGQPMTHFLGNWVMGNAAIPKHRPETLTEELKLLLVPGSRDAAFEKVSKALGKLLIVDGMAYQACHEPHIVMIQAIGGENTDRPTVTTRSMRIVTSEVHIRMAISEDADRVVPVTRFDVLHDMNRLFDRYGVTTIDETRRPEIEVWESIDEDAYWDRIGCWRMSQFIDANQNVLLGQMTPGQIAAVHQALKAGALAERDERLEAFEQAAKCIASAWPKYEHVESIEQLAMDLGAREISVSLVPSVARRAFP